MIETPKQPKKVLLEWIKKVKDEGTDLTDWELNFIESIEDKVNLYGSLSPRQQEVLERIYTDKTP